MFLPDSKTDKIQVNWRDEQSIVETDTEKGIIAS